MYREPAIRELHMQGVKLSTSCNATEGHTMSAKGQGTAIEYMHKAEMELNAENYFSRIDLMCNDMCVWVCA